MSCLSQPSFLLHRFLPPLPLILFVLAYMTIKRLLYLSCGLPLSPSCRTHSLRGKERLQTHIQSGHLSVSSCHARLPALNVSVCGSRNTKTYRDWYIQAATYVQRLIPADRRRIEDKSQMKKKPVLRTITPSLSFLLSKLQRWPASW